jgi:hypothetical protein
MGFKMKLFPLTIIKNLNDKKLYFHARHKSLNYRKTRDKLNGIYPS